MPSFARLTLAPFSLRPIRTVTSASSIVPGSARWSAGQGRC